MHSARFPGGNFWVKGYYFISKIISDDLNRDVRIKRGEGRFAADTKSRFRTPEGEAGAVSAGGDGPAEHRGVGAVFFKLPRCLQARILRAWPQEQFRNARIRPSRQGDAAAQSLPLPRRPSLFPSFPGW